MRASWLSNLVMILALASCKSIDCAESEQSTYAAEMRSGDWYLLCDNQKNCSIRGIAQSQHDKPGIRAMVMFERRAGMAQFWGSYVAFLEGDGAHRTVNTTDGNFSLISSANPRQEMSLSLKITNFSDEPLYELPRAPAFQSDLALYKPETIRSDDYPSITFAHLPQGNVLKLLLHAEDIQESTREQDRTDAIAKAFHRDFVRWDKMDDEHPLAIKNICGRETPIRSEHWRSAQADKLWLIRNA